jgi:glyoxylase-like metal-dependent hydrolase (beta-lactamase superfamily II)
MYIRLRKSLLYVIALAFITVFSSSFAQDVDQVQIKTVKVTDGVYMLMGYGGNIGVSVGENGILLIDCQVAELTEKIKAAIAEINSSPIRFVINTHLHYDHVGGNEPLGKAGALILAHDNVRKRMKTEWSHSFFDFKIPPYPEIALPVVTFTDSVTFHLNGDEIHAFHIENAHSDSDTVVYFRKANVVHMGDLYFVGGYPFIDVPHGGSINGFISAVDKVLDMIDEGTKVIPGHGPLSNREELQAYRDMLITVRDRILRQIEEGKTLEEVLASKPTADFDKGREQYVPPEGFVKLLYEDLLKR